MFAPSFEANPRRLQPSFGRAYLNRFDLALNRRILDWVTSCQDAATPLEDISDELSDIVYVLVRLASALLLG